MKKAQKIWNEMYNIWQSYNVVDISIRQLETQTIPQLRIAYWGDIKTNKIIYYKNAPILDTANHLYKLKDSNKELIAVFKIYSFLRNECNKNFDEFIWEGFSKFNRNFYWWEYNAKYILPEYDTNLNLFKSYDYKEMIYFASEAWKDIASNKEIIIL